MKRASILERIVEERVGHTFVGTVSVAVEKLAEEIAREALADEGFRLTIRELVREHSAAMLAKFRNGKPARSGRHKAELKAKKEE
jgi:hypothetical protein